VALALTRPVDNGSVVPEVHRRDQGTAST